MGLILGVARFDEFGLGLAAIIFICIIGALVLVYVICRWWMEFSNKSDVVNEVEIELGETFLRIFHTDAWDILQKSSSGNLFRERSPDKSELLRIARDAFVTMSADFFRGACVCLYTECFPSQTMPSVFRHNFALRVYFNSAGKHWGVRTTGNVWPGEQLYFSAGLAGTAAREAVGWEERNVATFESRSQQAAHPQHIELQITDSTPDPPLSDPPGPSTPP